jgi:drug/metabolite transporter (DMT)-like permease
MNLAVAYALVAMVCYGLSDFIYKQAAGAGIRADHFLMAQAWFFCPLVIFYALATGTLVPVPAALWGSLAGVFVFIGFYLFIRSLVAGSVSTNASIFRLNFIVAAVLAVILLGEPVTASKIAGLALALLATWLLVGAAGAPDRAAHAARRLSLGQVGAATLAFGLSNFFHTVGLRNGAGPETLAVAQAALFMPLATVVVFLVDRRLATPAITFKYGGGAAIVLVVATILLLHSIALGQASVMVPIAQMGFIVTALLGIVVLRERFTTRKAVGLACALGALAFLAAS